MTFLFGSKSKLGNPGPVVGESRKIRLLNEVVADTMSVKNLEHGRKLEDVWQDLRPVTDRLGDLFYNTRANLELINTLGASESLQPEELSQFISWGKKSQNLVNSVVATMKSKSETPS